MKRFLYQVHFLVFISLLMLLNSCKFIQPAKKEPYLYETHVKKTQIFGEKGKRKTYACGWAPIREFGELGTQLVMHNFSAAFHCNIQFFDDGPNKIIGKLVNPSHPNDPNQWEPVLTIPVKLRYYFEEEVDAYGKKTGNIIKSQRSHWKARPYMDLDFSGVAIHKIDYSPKPLGVDQLMFYNVRDYAMDFNHNGGKTYFAFTISAELKTHYSRGGADYRFNFLEFDHNDSFVKTPYNLYNSKYFNILHIIGEKAKDYYPILYASKWDVKKRNEFYLYNFPNEYVPIVKETLELWNEVLIEAKALDEKLYKTGKAGFFLNTDFEPEYSFDLRYPCFTWIEDKRIFNPQALGMALADVQNGEIIWGQVNLYAAWFKWLLEGDLPSLSIFGDQEASMNISSILEAPGLRTLSQPEIMSFDFSDRAMDRVTSVFDKYIANDFFEKLLVDANKEERSNLVELQSKSERLADLLKLNIKEGLENLIERDLIDINQKRNIYNNRNSYLNLYGLKNYYKELDDIVVNNIFTIDKSDLQAYRQLQAVGNVFDENILIEEVLPSAASAIAKYTGDEDEAFEKYLRNLFLHEFGHVLGLGHNFKANILPKDPFEHPYPVYQALSERATEENGYSNLSTVMGYCDTSTILATPYEDIKPGPHDLAAIRYLYTRQYQTFRKDNYLAPEKEVYKYFDLEADGIILPETKDPLTGKTYYTSYLPSCNDGESHYFLDPECAPFDIGPNAKAIVKNYIKKMNKNLISQLISGIDIRGGSGDWHEYYLSSYFWRIFSRLRLFYDHMRSKFKNEISEIKNDRESLESFSKACKMELNKIKIPKLKKLFSNSELKELCQVNGEVVEAINSMLIKPLRDFTRYDISNGTLPGGIYFGDIDSQQIYSRWRGTWKTLSNLPLKIPALVTLTNNMPFVPISYGYQMFIMPVHIFSQDEDAGYSYRTLYSNEYTETISNAVASNLRLANFSDELGKDPVVGKTILNMGYLLPREILSNDERKFHEDFISDIKKQTQFYFNYALVILEAIVNPKNNDLAQKFTASIIDFSNGKDIPADEVYMLPGGKVLIKAKDMFIYPVSSLKFYTNKNAYLYAYKLDYKNVRGDLHEKSVKKKLTNLYMDQMNICVLGTAPEGEIKNGLSSYFNNQDFQGFEIPPGIASGDSNTKYDEFIASVDEYFEKYQTDLRYGKYKPEFEKCIQAKKSMKAIMSAAGIVSGQWVPFIFETIDTR